MIREMRMTPEREQELRAIRLQARRDLGSEYNVIDALLDELKRVRELLKQEKLRRFL